MNPIMNGEKQRWKVILQEQEEEVDVGVVVGGIIVVVCAYILS